MENRFVTRGVEAALPLWLQTCLWSLRDRMKPESRDYLQVFQLIAMPCGMQKIMHRQEQPPYECDLELPSENGVTGKVFIIDDIDHVTMLLAEEY